MQNILADFQAISDADWRSKLTRDLKGVTFEELQRLDDNNIIIKPFYTKAPENAQPLFQHTDWEILEWVEVEEEAAANATALQALSRGANALHFELKKENCDWARLFQNIDLAIIHTYISGLPKDAEVTLQAYLQPLALPTTAVNWGQDAIASYVQSANIIYKDNIVAQNQNLFIDASAYLNAGSPSVQQLAYALAHLQEYLHQFEQAGALPEINCIHLQVAVGTAFFEEIAKLRALRQLVALLLEQYGLDLPVKIHVVTAALYKATVDVYNNMLRDTLAGMAAVLGGCNSLYISPFDYKQAKSNPAFSQRMSINQQLMMKEESFFNQVADAAQGSFYIEELTQALANQAWEHFKAIEREGGILAYFEQGKLVAEINTKAEILIAAYQSGKKPWIGVNKYPLEPVPASTAEQRVLSKDVVRPLELMHFIVAANQ